MCRINQHVSVLLKPFFTNKINEYLTELNQNIVDVMFVL